jgi:preprotein translocase subunit SecF
LPISTATGNWTSSPLVAGPRQRVLWLSTIAFTLLFGGAAINNFIIALLIGIVSGTYSSIFVASPLLVDWHLWEDRRHGRAAAARGPRVRRATP